MNYKKNFPLTLCEREIEYERTSHPSNIKPWPLLIGDQLISNDLN